MYIFYYLFMNVKQSVWLAIGVFLIISTDKLDGISLLGYLITAFTLLRILKVKFN